MSQLQDMTERVVEEIEEPADAAFELGQMCRIETAETRFGSHVSNDIRDFIFETPMSMFDDGDMDDDDDMEDEGDEDEEDDSDYDSDEEAAFPSLGEFVGTAGLQPAGAAVDQILEISSPAGPQGAPKVARARGNLTALSQCYNLYFAGYQDKIYVYQPQGKPHILPHSTMYFQAPRTKAAKTIGGTLDRNNGHMMNHLKVGYLGDEEILLLAYDDGDVVAYYTHLIAEAVKQRKGKPGHSQSHNAPRPLQIRNFFHDNVGVSAWGLAIHQQSRLLAVSSNAHEVTVFAFATRDKEKVKYNNNDASPTVWSGQTALELQRHFQSRTRTWRIVLPLSPEGHNIPSIDIIDNFLGDADKIVAGDVRGNTWILDIWKIGGHPGILQPSMSRGADNGSYMVWGVMVLPDSSFRPAKDNKSAMGLPPVQILGSNHSIGDGIRNDIWLDVTCSLYNVKNNAVDAERVLRNRHGNKYTLKNGKCQQPSQTSQHPQLPHPPHAPLTAPLQQQHSQSAQAMLESLQHELNTMATTNNPPQTAVLSLSMTGAFAAPFQPVLSPPPYVPSSSSASPTPSPGTQAKELVDRRWAMISKDKPLPTAAKINIEAEMRKRGFLPALTIVPTFGQTYSFKSLREFQLFLAQSPFRRGRTTPVPLNSVRFIRQAATRFSILRTTCTSVELQSVDPGSASVHCRDVLTNINFHQRRPTPWDLSQHICERISMHHHIPELGLVILGSLSGRVALLSLTKPPEPHRFGLRESGEGIPIPRAFKVEAVLPRKTDEEKRLRPWVALHGIAVSPAPDAGAKGLSLLRKGHAVRTWRLILHYMDHTILKYDLYRKIDDDDLMID